MTDPTKYSTSNTVWPGDLKFKDVNNDGIIDASDKTNIGSPLPKFTFGWSNTFTYKNLSLYMMFNGVFSAGMYGKANNFPGQNMQYINTVKYDYWTKNNTGAKYPWAGGSGTFIENYGFVRLQDVNLSYSFKAPWMEKARIGALQLYVSGRNLFFIAPGWDFSDPEVRSPYAVQLSRTYTVGVNVRF